MIFLIEQALADNWKWCVNGAHVENTNECESIYNPVITITNLENQNIVNNISYLNITVHHQLENEEDEPNVVYLEISFDENGKPVATGQLQGYVHYISYCVNENTTNKCNNIISLADLYTEYVEIDASTDKTFKITVPQSDVQNAVYYNKDYRACDINATDSDTNKITQAQINFTADKYLGLIVNNFQNLKPTC